MPVPEQARFTTPTMADGVDTRRVDQQFNGLPIFSSAEYYAYSVAVSTAQATNGIGGTFYNLASHPTPLIWRKVYDWTDFIVEVSFTAYATVLAGPMQMCLKWNNIDFFIAPYYFNALSDHRTITNWRRFRGRNTSVADTGWNAGKYSMQLTHSGVNTQVLNLDTNDSLCLRVTEVLPAQTGV
jgi:hypothetical protein